METRQDWRGEKKIRQERREERRGEEEWVVMVSVSASAPADYLVFH